MWISEELLNVMPFNPFVVLICMLLDIVDVDPPRIYLTPFFADPGMFFYRIELPLQNDAQYVPWWVVHQLLLGRVVWEQYIALNEMTINSCTYWQLSVIECYGQLEPLSTTDCFEDVAVASSIMHHLDDHLDTSYYTFCTVSPGTVLVCHPFDSMLQS